MPSKNVTCPQCNGNTKTVTEETRTYEKCKDCGYILSDTVKEKK